MRNLHLVLMPALNLSKTWIWHFDIGATSRIDDVLNEHGGLPHVSPLASHLNSFLAGTNRELF